MSKRMVHTIERPLGDDPTFNQWHEEISRNWEAKAAALKEHRWRKLARDTQGITRRGQ